MPLTSWAELVASGLITGGIYALVAMGLNLQYGLMRIMNISHGEFLMLGAFLTWSAHTLWGISPLLLMPLAGTMELDGTPLEPGTVWSVDGPVGLANGADADLLVAYPGAGVVAGLRG